MKVNRKITFNSRIVGFFAAMVMAWIFLTASPAPTRKPPPPICPRICSKLSSWHRRTCRMM